MEFQYTGGDTGSYMGGVYGSNSQPNTTMQQNPYAAPNMGQIGSAADYAQQFGQGLMGNLPGREANPLQTMDFANHPALQSAMEAFKQTTMPQIASAMSAAGLGRSGAGANAISSAQAQMALPVMQQLMDLEMQGMGLGVQQRGQDIGALENQLGLSLQGRGQDIGALLEGRGQDIGALLQGRGQDLTARGQNLDALLQQSGQGLQARGQNIGAMQAGMEGMTGLSAQDMARYQAGIGTLGDLGGTQRSIEDARYGAQYGEQERQYGLARDLLFGPLGQLTQQVGSRTTQSGGK